MHQNSAMILGLSHIGLTIGEVSQSTNYYRETFGFEVLSDAERKGQAVEKITGISGFHTRTVYLSVTPRQHLELFQFYNPQTPPETSKSSLSVGILYTAVVGSCLERIPSPAVKQGDKYGAWHALLKTIEEPPYNDFRLVTLQDPDGLFLRILFSDRLKKNKLLYAALIVADLEKSMDFYQNCLSLQVANQGECKLDNRGEPKLGTNGVIRWVILQAIGGECLKLMQITQYEVSPVQPWRMECIGFTHVAFAVHDLAEYYSILLKKGVRFKSEPQTITVGPHAGGRIVYMDTPDGIAVELIDSPLVQELWG